MRQAIMGFHHPGHQQEEGIEATLINDDESTLDDLTVASTTPSTVASDNAAASSSMPTPPSLPPTANQPRQTSLGQQLKTTGADTADTSIDQDNAVDNQESRATLTSDDG